MIYVSVPNIFAWLKSQISDQYQQTNQENWYQLIYGDRYQVAESLEMVKEKQESVIKKRKLLLKNKKPQKSQFYHSKWQQVLLLAIRMSSALEAESKKIQQIYEGPFIIQKCIHWDTFLLIHAKTKNRELLIFRY